MKHLAMALFALMIFCGAPSNLLAACIDPDANMQNANRDDYRIQSTTTGLVMLGFPSHSAAASRTDICGQDGLLTEYKCVAGSDFVNFDRVDCGRLRQGDICSAGACMTPIVLNGCGTPAGGWQNGKAYAINQNVAFSSIQSSTCFDLRSKSDIIFDCRGHSITMQDYDFNANPITYVFNVRDSKNITIKGCTLNDTSGAWVQGIIRARGINLQNSNDSKITGNSITNFAGIGLLLIGGNNNFIINNSLFGSKNTDLFLSAGNTDIGLNILLSNNADHCGNLQCDASMLGHPHWIFDGSGNFFLGKNCPREWLDRELYTECH